MSYYYTYYIGYYKKADGLIHPLGPYNVFNEMVPAFSVSQSFSSDLHDNFHKIFKAAASDELKKEFPYEGWDEEGEYSSLKMLAVSALPHTGFIKSGYVLIEDVKKYENGDYDSIDELFQEWISPTVYASMLSNELLLGKQTELVFYDEEGNSQEEEEVSHSAGEYMFYSFPDYYCEEYESFILNQFVKSMSLSDKISAEDELVILLVEG